MNRFTSLGNSVTALLTAFSLAVIFAAPTLLFAQEKSADSTNMEILREKLKADKKLVVAGNMTLTDAEAKGFWPIYEEYQKDLEGLNTRLKKVIANYAEAYNTNVLTDDTAKKLSDEALAVDEAEIQMRKTYATKLAKVLPGKKVARYMQIENKVRAVLRYELAAGIPLVE